MYAKRIQSDSVRAVRQEREHSAALTRRRWWSFARVRAAVLSAPVVEEDRHFHIARVLVVRIVADRHPVRSLR